MSLEPRGDTHREIFLSEQDVRFRESTKAKIAWAGACVGTLALAFLIISGRLTLTLAAGSSVALVGLVILTSIRNQHKLILLFSLNACLLIISNRNVAGMDVAALVTLVAALLTSFSIALNKPQWAVSVDHKIKARHYDAAPYLLIGFALLSVLSTWVNSQSIIVVVPWLSGITLALLITWLPYSQMPSFSIARRAILVGGAVTAIYDLYLLTTGRALNVGPFNAGRFLGSLGDYELLAEFYGAIILLALTAIFFDGSRVWRLGSAALIVPGFLIILATQSRGPVILLGVVAPVLIVISAFQFRESAGKIVAVVGCVALSLGASIGTLINTPWFERFSVIQFGGSVETTLNRAGVWDYFTQLREFVDLGLVGNGFEYPYEEIGTFPHSLYLWLLWSGGPAIIICFALFVCLLFGTLLRGVLSRHSGSLSAAAIISYILLDEVKIEAARTSPTVGFLWVFLSLGLLAGRELKELRKL